jgi:hypothetical protein
VIEEKRQAKAETKVSGQIEQGNKQSAQAPTLAGGERERKRRRLDLDY